MAMERFRHPASNDQFEDASNLDALLHPAQAHDAIGAAITEERARMLAHVKAAVDDLRRELAKDIGGLEGKQQARFGTLEPRIARVECDVHDRVRRLEAKLDRALGQFSAATCELNPRRG
jgi:hypothetical protein